MIKRRLKLPRWTGNEFYRNIASLFSGMFVARIIPALFAVPIARLYSPEHFGDFVLYLTIASALSIVATGKYESALVLVDTGRERSRIFAVGQKVNTLLNGILFLAMLLWTIIFQSSRKTFPDFALIPVYSFFFSSLQLIRSLFIARKQFKWLARLEISRSIFTGLVQCALFMLPEHGLFLGATMGVGLLSVYFFLKENETHSFLFRRLNPEEKKLARRFINFPKFSVLSEVFNFLSSQLPVFLIKPFFGSIMLGQYAFSHRYISIPVQLFSKSISSVYLQKCRELLKTPEELGQLTLSLFKKQVWAALFPFLILSLWGAPIFAFVFGEEWRYAGFLAQLISPWLFTVMIGSPLSVIMIAREKQKLSMYFNTLLLLFRAVALCTGGFVYRDIVVAVGLYSLVSSLFFVTLTGYSLNLATVRFRYVLSYILKVGILIIPFIIAKLLWG